MAASRASRTLTALVVVTIALVVGACGGGDSGGPNALTWFIFNEPSGAPQKAADKCSKESGGEYKIEFEFLPADADEQREQLVRRLGAEDDSIDLIGMDVIWTGEFANAGWIDPVPASTAQVVTENVFPSVLETAKFEGELYAAPLWSNTQLLWYRKDLVEKPPKTWDEMIDEALKLNPDENLIQVQANRYEGLVVWSNQMIESAGGQILAGPEEVALEEEPTERALEVMGRLSTSDAADPAITTSEEDPPARLRGRQLGLHDQLPVRLSERRGERAGHLQGDEGGEVPGDRRRDPAAPPLGGINLGVSAFSKNKDLAFEAIECLVKPRTSSRPRAPAACRRCARTSTTRRRSRRSIPASRRSSASRSPTPPRGRRSRPPTRTSRWRSSAPCTRRPRSTPRTRRATYDDAARHVEQAIKREGLL